MHRQTGNGYFISPNCLLKENRLKGCSTVKNVRILHRVIQCVFQHNFILVTIAIFKTFVIKNERAGWPGDRSSIHGREERIFPVASVSRPPLGCTQPPVQWVPGVLSPGLKRGRGVTLTTHPHIMPRSRMSRSYTSSPPKRLHGMLWDSFIFSNKERFKWNLYVCPRSFNAPNCLSATVHELFPWNKT
jgi:hypothetical protein